MVDAAFASMSAGNHSREAFRPMTMFDPTYSMSAAHSGGASREADRQRCAVISPVAPFTTTAKVTKAAKPKLDELVEKVKGIGQD